MKSGYSGKLTFAKKGKRRLFSAIFFAKEISGVGFSYMRGPVLTRIDKALDRACKRTAYTTARAYGYMMLSFGILSLIIHLARYYFEENPTVLPATLIASAAIAIVGVALALVDKPMCVALQDFRLTDLIFFEFFSIKRMPRDVGERGIPPIVCIFIGMIPAAISYFVPILAIVGVIGALIFVTVSFISPEFPLIFTILAVPYINAVPYTDLALSVLLGVTILSFFRKVMLGKRVFIFGISDVLLLLLATVVVAFGVIGGGSASTEASLLIALFTLGYIPTANMIVNRRLADCASNAVVISAIPSAVYSVVNYLIHLANGELIHSSAFMSTPDALAAHLLVAVAFSAFLFKAARGGARLFYSGAISLFLIALFTTTTAPVLIVLLVSIPAFLLVTRTRLPRELLIILYLVPLAVFFLPTAALYTLSDTLDMSVTLSEMRAGFFDSLRLFLDNLVMGVGADMVSSDGVSVFAAGTMLGFALRFGVLAVVILLLILALRLAQASLYSRYINASSLRYLSAMTLISMFMLLTLGWFADLTYSPEVYLFFFLVFGLSTAALRVSRSEYELSLGYFGDNIDVDSSDADITIRA